jgi:hypothetical protein
MIVINDVALSVCCKPGIVGRSLAQQIAGAMARQQPMSEAA